MNWLDIVIIAFLLLAASIGSKIGFIRMSFLFGALFLGTILAGRLYTFVSPYLKGPVQDPNLRDIISFTAIFVPVLIGGIIAGNWMRKGIQTVGLSWMDRWMGGLLGLLIGVLVVGITLMILKRHPVSNSQAWIRGSFLAQAISYLMKIITAGGISKGIPKEVGGGGNIARDFHVEQKSELI